MESCRVCSSKTEVAQQLKILKKYQITYYKCSYCGLLFTEKPYWIMEAYTTSIAACDTGRAARSLYNALRISPLVHGVAKNDDCIDWGGGDGLFSRLMRDFGFRFWPEDKYTENSYCKNLKPPIDENVNFLTSFEVFEHLEEPIAQLKEPIERLAPDYICFSTIILPEPIPKADWWYYLPETGQHLSFYEHRTLKLIATKLGYTYKQLGSDLHLFYKGKRTIFLNFYGLLVKSRLVVFYGILLNYLKRKKSLTWADHLQVKNN